MPFFFNILESCRSINMFKKLSALFSLFVFHFPKNPCQISLLSLVAPDLRPLAFPSP